MYSDPKTHLTDELLHEYLDRELDPEPRHLIQQHLGTCGECIDRLNAWSSLFTSIEQLPDLDLVKDFAPRVLSRLAIPTRRRSRAIWLTVGQASLAILLMAYGWMQMSIQLPAELIQHWFSLPLQTLAGMVNGLSLGMEEAFNQFLAASPSTSELIATIPQVQFGGSLLTYLGILLIFLWLAGNHYLLSFNGHQENAHS
jgi:predicted anti-sigma-YlaC factor YlaD